MDFGTDRFDHFIYALSNFLLESAVAKDRVDNSVYDTYGDRWYTAFDDPVALLRAESRVKTPWILERIRARFRTAKILDVGCGAGFLSNALAAADFQVYGVDLSESSLEVARRYDRTGRVTYICADAFQLPFADQSFDVITAMDFLEHIEDPARVIQEFSRVLKPGGMFFFHTFNRSALAWLVIIKAVEWLVRNTPPHMHVLHLFIKPVELRHYCSQAGLRVEEMTGIRPRLSTIPWTKIFSGVVPKEMQFQLSKSLKLSYLGMASKNLVND
jgi:2-polyprenyl-6-hydroxyphenyl methylase/3-demethylubiquinone-9 3-methyltransferase